ncbi:MAG: nitrogenase cofactor biosynthesis protein NifB [Methanosarcinales archaeon]|nr:nitrogenase cofactor biosynthesis protein NifB [Methanosarcinales archaeon]
MDKWTGSKSEEGSKALHVAEVEGKKVPWDPTQLRKIQEHPCFSENACHFFGRMHLAVAPKCNIQCNYCIRKFDCVNESRPGVTSKVLTPQEALERVREVLEKVHYIKVVAVAGPGEPLFNEETFETFRLIKGEFPRLMRCLSTNGLLLPERIDDIEELGVGTVTVTLNAVDPEIGKEIYSFVNYHGERYKGKEAAELLLKNQLEGIREAVKRKILIKVNTVYIPTVNDTHIIEVAKTVGEMGVYLQNVIPLIPQFKFAQITPPTPQEKMEMQDACSEYTRQMKHCRQCRADAIGRLGKDIQDQFSET